MDGRVEVGDAVLRYVYGGRLPRRKRRCDFWRPSSCSRSLPTQLVCATVCTVTRVYPVSVMCAQIGVVTLCPSPLPPARADRAGGACSPRVWAVFEFCRCGPIFALCAPGIVVLWLWWACVCIIIYNCNYPVSSETPSASRPRRRETELSGPAAARARHMVKPCVTRPDSDAPDRSLFPRLPSLFLFYGFCAQQHHEKPQATT